ncbi:hypothetical protein [Variovorax paradoxus]|uniref:hypothetical protein n=1 Tax=Variovorax paradoxus TaxID=34073 RepID=UPI0027887F13|nr:hypothetical protein [Variovorax paradoxus]MDP9932971.1 hypothetical protein [Variovorax paradoxus]
MNRKQAPATPADTVTRQPASGLPLEAEVRAKDLELDESPIPDDTANDEAQPGTGENAPGFLKRRKP